VFEAEIKSLEAGRDKAAPANDGKNCKRLKQNPNTQKMYQSSHEHGSYHFQSQH